MVISRLLPAAVSAREAYTDLVPDQVYPGEAAAVAHAVEKRRREFLTVRACARAAMQDLRQTPVPILPSTGGAPLWPVGLVGSMTHCTGYRAAAVARAADVVSLGIDAEPNSPLPDGVLEQAALPDDLPALVHIQRLGVAADRLLFSAKEAVFKTWYPVTHRWLDFEDVHVELRPDGTFTAHLMVELAYGAGRALDTLDGRWLAERNLVLTAVCLLPT